MNYILTKTNIKRLISTGIASFAVPALAFVPIANAVSAVGGCTFDDSTSGVWSLTSDCTSTSEIYVPANTTLEGNGHTISAGFAKTDTSNNAVIGILENNVTVQNLTINGTGGTNLHGINVFDATGVVVNHVTLTNVNRIGVNVNGSEVTVSNTATSGSGWWAIDVDNGAGTVSSVLNLGNGNTHAEATQQVYVDDTTKAITVNDLYGNYVKTTNPPVGGPNDALYTLRPVVKLATKDQCKNDGWKTSTSPAFKNQGDCVSSFASKNK